jgi:prevent-host-death family protein
MESSVSDAKAQLLDLVRRAEAGEEIVLTRHGERVVRLVPATTRPSVTERRRLIEAMFGVGRPGDGVTAARSQDFLFDELGLPKCCPSVAQVLPKCCPSAAQALPK